MSLIELPIAPPAATGSSAPPHDERWLAAARRARQLSWASVLWMTKGLGMCVPHGESSTAQISRYRRDR